MRRSAADEMGLKVALAAAGALPTAVALAHELFDHAPPSLGGRPAPTTAGADMGPASAKWEFITSIATGNPHTDLDFFTQNGETYMAAGTLAAGPNSGGQTIFKLTEGGEVVEDAEPKEGKPFEESGERLKPEGAGEGKKPSKGTDGASAEDSGDESENGKGSEERDAERRDREQRRQERRTKQPA